MSSIRTEAPIVIIERGDDYDMNVSTHMSRIELIKHLCMNAKTFGVLIGGSEPHCVRLKRLGEDLIQMSEELSNEN